MGIMRMNFIEIMFSAVLNIFSIIITFRILEIFLDKKDISKNLLLLVKIIVWLINFIVYYKFNNIYITNGSIIMLMIIASILVYKGSVFGKIIAVFSSIGLGTVVEEIVWRFFSYYNIAEEMELFGGLITVIIQIIIVLILERYVSVKKGQYITNQSYINILMVLLGNVILIYLLAGMESVDRTKILLALISICIIDISTFWIHNKVNEVYREEIERQIMSEQILMYKKQFQIIEQSQNRIESFRHDIKNHLLLLYNYLDNDKSDMAKKYINDMQKISSVPEQYIKTGNSELDAVLNYSLSKADKMNCTIETNISVPRDAFIQGYELVMLLGNMLDNSIEALEKVNNKYLYVGITVNKGLLLIRIKNTFDGIVETKEGFIKTRKKESEIHGIGLRNVDEIVKKYDGELNININGNYFVTDVLMYL